MSEAMVVAPPASASRSVTRRSAVSMREAARAVDVAQHVGLVAAHLQQHDADLRLAHEVALHQAVGDEGLGLRDGLAADAHAAQQRVADDAGFADARLQRQVGVLEDGDAQHVAGAQPVLGGGGRGGCRCRRGGRGLLCERRRGGGQQGHGQRGSQERAAEGNVHASV
jgi:hypothetical protein